MADINWHDIDASQSFGKKEEDSVCMQTHGSLPYKELRSMGIQPETILDFSATINPFPMPERVRELFAPENITAYPDIQCYAARRALADLHAVPIEHILVTAGLTEAIFLLPFIAPLAVQLVPAYGDYRAAYSRETGNILDAPFPEDEGDITTVADTVRSLNAAILIFCNPNNPDGRYLPAAYIDNWCKKLPDTVICVDESYQELGDRCESVLPLIGRHRNLMVLKSLTKPYGIGGLRMGYVVCAGKMLDELKRRILPWGVCSIAQRIIPALVENRTEFELQWKSMQDLKTDLRSALSSVGIATSCKKGPFFLAHVSQPSLVRRLMLRHLHIAVRDCTSFGMRNTLRIMPSLPENNLRLVEAFRQYG